MALPLEAKHIVLSQKFNTYGNTRDENNVSVISLNQPPNNSRIGVRPSPASMMQSSNFSARELIDSASLTYFIPLATDFDVEDAFRDAGVEKGLAIESVECRDSLFFGTARHSTSTRPNSHLTHHRCQMNPSMSTLR